MGQILWLIKENSRISKIVFFCKKSTKMCQISTENVPPCVSGKWHSFEYNFWVYSKAYEISVVSSLFPWDRSVYEFTSIRRKNFDKLGQFLPQQQNFSVISLIPNHIAKFTLFRPFFGEMDNFYRNLDQRVYFCRKNSPKNEKKNMSRKIS